MFLIYYLLSHFNVKVNLTLSTLSTLLLLLIGVRCARPGESENTGSVQRHQPHTTNTWKEKRENSRRQKRKRGSCLQENIDSALETRQYHTIKHRVTKIVPKRYREGHKASVILRSLTTRKRRERVPPDGRIGKVVASHAAVARSRPAEVALIYTMHVALRGYCPWGWGCDQSIASTVSDAIVRSCLYLTATRSYPLDCFSTLLEVVDNWPHILW